MKYQAPRGTEDVLPNDVHRWHWVESTFRATIRPFGFREIRTPTFEDTEVFTRTAGETSDIVTKEMYTFRDKGDRSVTLKPEGTAPVMRAVLEHNLCPTGAIARLAYITPFFRYERPQKGRLREAHQCGLEFVGSAAPDADVEVIELTYRFIAALGLENIEISLNSIGDLECRGRFRDAVLGAVSGWLAEQNDEMRAKAEKNPLRLLDSKEARVQEALTAVPPITDFLSDASRDHFEAVQTQLAELGVPTRLDPKIVRGLDYYNDTVFEVVSSKLGAQSSLCGGGRYDGLVAQLGGPATPSVGVGVGIERLLIAIEESGINPPVPHDDVFIIAATPDAAATVRQIRRELRQAGFAVVTDPDARSMKSQLRQADRAEVPIAILVGTDELAKGTAQVKHLTENTQVEVALADVVAHVEGVQ